MQRGSEAHVANSSQLCDIWIAAPLYGSEQLGTVLVQIGELVTVGDLRAPREW